MGSFQQVSIGAICLCAAFFFGNYINNNPPLSKPPFGDNALSGLENGIAANSNLSEGKVESRIPLSRAPFSSLQQQPAPMATLKRPLRLQSAFPQIPQVETSQNTTAWPNRSEIGQTTLPPPSQLAGGQRNNSPFNNPPQFGGQRQAGYSSPSIQIPDFSAIAAEFKNNPVRLPKMGMPIHGNNVSREVGHSGAEPFANQSQPSKPLKDLVSQFRNGNQGSVDRRFAQSQNQANSSQAEIKFTPPPTFSSEDFEPQLNDNIFGLKARGSNDIGNSSDLAEHKSRQESRKTNNTATWKQNQFANSNSQSNSQQTQAKQVQESSGQSYRAEGTFSSPEDISMKWPNRATPDPDIAPDPRHNHSSNQVRTRIPFALNEQAKTDLVRLRNRAENKMGLDSTKFVSHTIENGETLQSISTRYFGEPDYYLDIYLANRDKLRNPGQPPKGVTIKVPVYKGQ